jgi:biotin synthase
LERTDAEWLFGLEDPMEIQELMVWAGRLRERHHGRRIHLCSIVNIKSGGCPENCKFCAQSAFYEGEAARHDLIESTPISKAMDEAAAHGIHALGLVAAWRELREGPMLEDICALFEEMARAGKLRLDASLGMIRSRGVAARLQASGVACYNHNLETSRRFFPQVCTTHTFDDRLETIGHLRAVGIQICCGGILGLGETWEDRCDLAFSLKEVDPEYVPINILNPIAGTPFEKVAPLTPWEILKTIACFRLILPRVQILVAGGRVVNLRDLQPLIFLAGASALMVGNYLTTVNQPVEQDLRLLKDLGLGLIGGP